MLLPLRIQNTSPPLFTAMSPNHRAHFAEYRRHGYLSNGWDPLFRWNGYTSGLEPAGIVAPDREPGSWAPVPTTAPGVTRAGIHRIRYRYQDSQTGYVSNPSSELEVNPLTGQTALTFSVEAAPGSGTAADIRRTSELKVDRVVLESTVADGSVFFVVGIFTLTLALSEPVVFDLGDAALEVSFRPWPNTGHEPPPIGRWVLSHRERLWIYSQVVHRAGQCAPTNGSFFVGGGPIDPDWRASALGDHSVTPKIFSSVQWLFQVDGDARIYEVDFYDANVNALVLGEPYTGATSPKKAYRLFSRSNILWVSNPGYPEAFQPLTFIQGPQGEMSGEITACLGFNTALIVFTTSAMHRLTWDLGPQVDPVLTPISTKYGALSQRVVVGVETAVYTMDRLGWHSFGGVRDVHMSREIDELLEEVDFDLLDLFHAVYLPRIRAIRWHICLKGDVWPQHYVQWDLDSKTWGTGEFEVGITESTLRLTGTGPRVLLGDENGWLWFGETGTTDGAPGDDSVLRVAIEPRVPAPTQIYVEKQDLEVGTFGMSGSIAYWIEGDEFRYVFANTVNSISVAAFSSAPQSGDTILIGRVKARLKTKAFSGRRGPREVNRQDYFWLLSNPTTALRYALVRFFEDGSPVAKSDWGKDRREESVDGVDHPGTVPGLAPSDWRVDLRDVARRIPVGENWKNTLEVEIDFYWPDSRVEVFALELGSEDGAERLQ